LPVGENTLFDGTDLPQIFSETDLSKFLNEFTEHLIPVPVFGIDGESH
jgi:hypothetical protein